MFVCKTMKMIKNLFSFKGRLNKRSLLPMTLMSGVLFSLLIPTYLTFAYIPSSFDPGGKNNPFYFQETQDYNTEKRNQNTQTERYLKNTYGVSNYYDCRSSASSCGYESDVSDPSVWGSCLSYIQYCLERKAINNNRSDTDLNSACIGKFGKGSYFSKRDSTGGTICGCKNGWNESQTACITPSNDQLCSEEYGQNWKWGGTKNDTGGLICGCKDGYTQKNGQCVSHDQACNISFPNTIFTKIDDVDGTRTCDCKTGYTWNDQRTSCIVAPVVDRNKQCQEKYPNSSLIGQYCDCGNGYQWNHERTQCVVVPIKTNDQICSDKFGQNSNWDGTKDDDGKLNCGCKSGYEVDATQNECVAVSVKSNQQICAENYSSNGIWTGETNDKGGPICDCKAGYQWNQGQSSCVVIPKPKITTESSSLKKDGKSPEKADQQSSLNSSAHSKDKDGNSSLIFSDKADLIYKDVGTTTIERKNPEQKSVWKRVKRFFGF